CPPHAVRPKPAARSAVGTRRRKAAVPAGRRPATITIPAGPTVITKRGTMPQNETIESLGLDQYKYGFVTKDKPVFKAQRGLSEEVVRQISAHKEEPEWMLQFRLKALEIYRSKPMPTWGGDLSQLDAVLDDLYYYIKPADRMQYSWDD